MKNCTCNEKHVTNTQASYSEKSQLHTWFKALPFIKINKSINSTQNKKAVIKSTKNSFKNIPMAFLKVLVRKQYSELQLSLKFFISISTSSVNLIGKCFTEKI